MYADPVSLWKTALSSDEPPMPLRVSPGARDREVADRIDASRDRLLRHVPLSLADRLAVARGKRLPIPSEPRFFANPLRERPTQLLLGYPGLASRRPEIERIFERSTFRAGDRRFRTTRSGGFSFIEGQDEPDFRSLMCLIHELGHCLFENSPAPGPADPFGSESAAHLLEESLGASLLAVLRPDALPAWHEYLRAIDLLNLGYFARESGIPNPWGEAVEARVSPSCDVFRESLFATPGYQVQYAMATLRRAEQAWSA